MSDPKDTLFYAVNDLHRQMRRWFEARTADHGLTMPQWRAIGQLCKSDGISQARLAGLIESDPMTVSGLIERLETKGLVVRQPDPADSRAKIVTVTDDARALYAEMLSLLAQDNERIFQGVSETERAATLTVLSRVSANLMAATEQPEAAS